MGSLWKTVLRGDHSKGGTALSGVSRYLASGSGPQFFGTSLSV